ncbi:hypothetical protein FISHEDRAFT_32603 [Fistulina hepatica ATCC 64428]|uniref:Uncharacterized protein n=1 Tax=Fistulina hepatica ATCC 64428 TaxID=1128425 RepID=A0A0D7APP0_9AGAR|nr:hypothetical protein FISHEDRAFT_32603 [Fistulina hepatica ATCC 64428]
MVIHISNPYDEVIDVCGGQTVVTKPRIKTEEIARRFIGARTFINWPFLQEATVVAVSDNLFRYEKLAVVPGVKPRVVGSPHTHQGIGHFHSKAERIESAYSKRFAVITGNIDVLLHVRPLKGLKRLDNGALVKEYVGPSKETECAVQMAVSKVYSEDPRYLERGAPPLSEEFPDGSKIFFLGEHAYGVAAQVSATTDTTLSVMIAFFPSDKKENEEFKAVVRNSISEAYTPAFQVAKILRMSGRALSRITSSFMVVTSDKQKTNIGLSLKFEAKGLKVIDYSRKNGTHWEFSEKTINLIREYRDKFPHVFECLDASGDAMARGEDLFPDGDSIAQVKAIKAWLKIKGVPNFEPVSLFADKLPQDVVAKLEQLSDTYNTKRSSSNIKKAIVRNIPRQAVLKPAHAVYRLQSQRFALGDRVTMIQDSGAVPLSFKGSVVGLTAKHMDVVWDVPFMAGTTLDNRCSQYRGATVEFAACLNLSDPQFVTSTSVVAPYVQPAVTHPHNPAFKPRIGPHPAIYPTTGNAPAAGFRPAPLRGLGGPPVVHSHHAGPSSQPVIAQPQRVHIMANPHRAQTSATARESGQAQAMHTTASHNTAPAQVQIRGAPPARSLVRGRAQGPVGGSFNSPVRPGEGRGRSANYADTSGRGAGAPFVPRGRPRIFRGRGRATYP